MLSGETEKYFCGGASLKKTMNQLVSCWMLGLIGVIAISAGL